MEQLPTVKTRMGKIIGGEAFINKAVVKYDRRKTPEQTLESRRIDDLQFISTEQVYHEFQQIKGIKIQEVDTCSIKGKRLRAELLVYLKDRAGLTYTDIVKMPEFSDIKVASLRAIYRNAKIKMGKK